MESRQIAGDTLQRAFAQPMGQALPREFLALLVEFDRSKRMPVAVGMSAKL
jgi:hypothetical protein